jgi:hypothetical protein
LNKELNCNAYFSGGGGMFIQYHDVVKPVYLYAIVKMLISKQSYGLPSFILGNMSNLSLVEWYTRRRYINPFQQLDFNHSIPKENLDKLLKDVLASDSSIYKLAPALNIQRMLDSAKHEHLSFPVFIYSEYYDKNIEEDCKSSLHGYSFTYTYGDLKESLAKCDQNFTYIFSDIELMKNACKILAGTCSHILMASDYRYNYSDNMKHFKYDLRELAKEYPYARTGVFSVMDMNAVVASLIKLKK